jgi:hypothetical protein
MGRKAVQKGARIGGLLAHNGRPHKVGHLARWKGQGGDAQNLGFGLFRRNPV